jgi:phosphoribosylformylglycinamidine synthase
VILTLLSSPNIASREWVYRQYDHEVGVRTVLKPGMSDAAVLKLPNGRFLALKSDGNSAHSYLDPYHAAAGCVSEACRNVVAVGAKPTAVVDHLQFGDPGDPEVYWTFVEAVRGLADYCKALRLPIVGGKVSFYNEDQVTGQAVKPSPVVLVLGLIDEAAHIRTMGFKKDGNALLLVGETRAEMGGSELYEHLYGVTGGAVPKVKRARDRTLFLAILHLIRSGVAQAVHDCSKGGLAIALAEMCLARSKGVTVDLTKAPSTTNRQDDLLFSETHGRFLVEVDPAYSNSTVELLRGKGLVSGILGQVGGSTYRIKQGSHRLAELDLDAMAHAWSAALPRLMGGVS